MAGKPLAPAIMIPGIPAAAGKEHQIAFANPTRQTESGTGDPIISCEPADNWTLLEGHNVEIHEHGRMIDRGHVETVTTDGDILWLAFDGATARRMVQNLPGRHVRIADGQPGTIKALAQTPTKDME